MKERPTEWAEKQLRREENLRLFTGWYPRGADRVYYYHGIPTPVLKALRGQYGKSKG